MQAKTEQDRIREVMEARKTMKKFAKVAWFVGAAVIAGVSFAIGGVIPFVVVAVAEVGAGYFLQYSFKHSDAEDLKRIQELDANPAKGQGQAAQAMMGANAELAQQVQNDLSALAASAAKMESEKESTLAAINTLKEQVANINKALVQIRTFIGQIDESKASKVELQQLTDLQDQEKAQLEKLSNIGQQARDLKIVLDKSLVSGAVESSDEAQVAEALRSIKIGAAVNAQMKDIH